MIKNFKIFSFIVLFFTATFSYASEASKFCPVMAKNAGMIMEGRQQNQPARELIAVAEKQKHEYMRKILYKMILRAYRTPLYTTAVKRSNAVVNFRNHMEAICYNGMGLN